jgi:hypothetical protein
MREATRRAKREYRAIRLHRQPIRRDRPSRSREAAPREPVGRRGGARAHSIAARGSSLRAAGPSATRPRRAARSRRRCVKRGHGPVRSPTRAAPRRAAQLDQPREPSTRPNCDRGAAAQRAGARPRLGRPVCGLPRDILITKIGVYFVTMVVVVRKGVVDLRESEVRICFDELLRRGSTAEHGGHHLPHRHACAVDARPSAARAFRANDVGMLRPPRRRLGHDSRIAEPSPRRGTPGLARAANPLDRRSGF